jgi:glycosyltransferase involved in cell wall biosynthesis
MRAEIVTGNQPQRDYFALQEALDADVMYPNDAQKTLLGRLITKFLGVYVALVWAAFRSRHSYDVLYSDSEVIGLPLAMLLKLAGTRPGHPRHVMLSHHLSPLKKRIFFWLGVGSHIDALIVHCAALRTLVIEKLHMPGERVVKLPYFVDVHFWRPSASAATDDTAVTDTRAEQRPIICSAGLECRDYPTLLAAVRELDVDVHVAAASASAFHRAVVDPGHRASTNLSTAVMPENVFIKRRNYAEMRQLYKVAQFAVVTLLDGIDAAAGVTVILEAMAMGKVVVVSGTRGQTDVVRDLRNNGRGLMKRQWWPGFLDAPGVSETLGQLPTGFYVAPGDPVDLRHTIQYLLDHPELAEELGRNGRRVAEAYFSLDAFARRFAATIRGEPLPVDCPSGHSHNLQSESVANWDGPNKSDH